MDLTASILAAAGVAGAGRDALDGMNLLPILEGRAPEVERTLFWRVSGARQQQAVRSGRLEAALRPGAAAALQSVHATSASATT